MKSSSIIKFFISICFFFLFLLICTQYLKIFGVKEDINYEYETKTWTKDSINVAYPYFGIKELDQAIGNIVHSMDLEGITKYNAIILDEKYLNIFWIGPNNTYKSNLINLKTYKEDAIGVLLKDEKIFQEKIREMLRLKYPLFVVENILNNEKVVSYNIMANKIDVYFSNYIITPIVNENIFVEVNNHELKEILKYNYELDKEYVNSNVYVLDPNKKTVALTFDDGPSNTTTPQIVEILQNNKATATFFQIGNRMHNGSGAIQKILESGSEIGNHSYSHKRLTRLKDDEWLEEVNYPNEIFKSITNEELKYFRMPYGSINQKIRENISLPIISWSLDTLDWKYKDVVKINEEVLNNIEDGDIILMHDIHLTTVEAVRILLPELYSRGFQVVSVSKLAELKGVTLENGKIYNKIV